MCWGAQDRRGKEQPADPVTVLANQSGPGPLLPGPEWHSEAPVRPTVPYTHTVPCHSCPHPRVSAHHASGFCIRARTLPHNEGGQMDAEMDRVTGFQHLQKAALQAAAPAFPQTRDSAWRRHWQGDQLIAKRPRTCPGLATALGPAGKMGGPEAAQHGDRYTHISLTLSQVTQSRTERNKNKELVSPQRRREQAPVPRGTPGGQAEGCAQPVLWPKS